VAHGAVSAGQERRFITSAFVPELAPDTAWLSLPLPETSGKRVQLLREVAPTVARVAVLSHASLPSISADVRETEAAALAFSTASRLSHNRRDDYIAIYSSMGGWPHVGEPAAGETLQRV